jgi:hypothetical protein
LDTLISGEGMLTTEAHGYLERLDIAHKVSVRDGAFTTSDLSTGPRKWLTLVQAYLDTPPGDVARRMGRQPGPELPLDFLWRDSAGPEASGQNADRDFARRSLFERGRPLYPAGRRPHRRRSATRACQLTPYRAAVTNNTGSLR